MDNIKYPEIDAPNDETVPNIKQNLNWKDDPYTRGLKALRLYYSQWGWIVEYEGTLLDGSTIVGYTRLKYWRLLEMYETEDL